METQGYQRKCHTFLPCFTVCCASAWGQDAALFSLKAVLDNQLVGRNFWGKKKLLKCFIYLVKLYFLLNSLF